MSADVKGGLREVVARIIWNQFHSRHGGPFYPGAKPSDSIAMALTFEAADHILAVLPTADLLEALKKAEEFIDGIQQDLHSQRAADWYPEGAHDAASSMSESMRLIGNSCADFTAAQVAIAKAEGPSS